MRTVFTLLLLAGLFVPATSLEDFFSSSEWLMYSGARDMPVQQRHPLRDEVWVNGGAGLYIQNPKTNQGIGGVEGLPVGYGAVWSLAFDSFGNAWIGHRLGLSRYNEASKTMTNYTPADGLPTGNVQALFFDKTSRRLLVGTTHGFAQCVLNASGLPSAGWESMIPTTTDKVIHSVAYSNGEVWAFNAEKIYCFTNGGWVSYDKTNSPMSAGISGYSFIDNDGTVWATGAQGTFPNEVGCVFKFNRSSGTWDKLQIDGLAFGDVGRLVIDRNRILWLAGSKALARVDLNVTPLVAKRMLKYDNSQTLNSDMMTVTLNPAGGLLLNANQAIEDTTGLGAYYKSVASVVRPSRALSYTIVPDNARFIGIFSVSGKMVAGPFSSSFVLSSGSYFTLYRTADGRNIVYRTISLTANPLKVR